MSTSSDTTSRFLGISKPIGAMLLTSSEISEFRDGVLRFYREAGREFPWRRTRDPWLILSSEVMLQQTRAETVESKWGTWVSAYPTAEALAASPLAEVLARWKGLGYNRRALALRDAAARILSGFGGSVPQAEENLRSLPGVGPYTARAVRAFAFGLPGVVIETNIRAVFLFYFFPDREKVPDREIEPFIEATQIREDPRTWYYALMDYGAALKKREPNPGRRSASYSRQSRFAGSHRQVRAAVLHSISTLGPLSPTTLREAVADTVGPYAGNPEFDGRLARAVEELTSEGFLELREGLVRFKD